MTKRNEDFTNVSELDAFLDDEFAKATASLDEPDEPKVEEPTVEAPEEEDEMGEDEEDDTPEEVVESTKEEPKPKRTKEEKREHAFAELRKEASDAKKALEERDALLTRLMKEAGYDKYDEFKGAVDKQLSQKEMKEKGYTETQYSEIEQLRKRTKELEDQVALSKNQAYIDKAKNFDGLVKTYAQKFGTDAKTIYDDLQKTGYTVDTLLAQPNPEILIKGLLADKIKTVATKEIVDQKAKRKSVDTEKLPTGNQKSDDFDLDEYIKKDLADYAKRKGKA